MTGWLVPKPDVTSTGNRVPAPPSTAGQMKSTRSAELWSTGTALPLTVTLVPPRSNDAPVASQRSVSGDASHLPVIVAIAPGLHDDAAAFSAGRPASTSSSTCAVDDCRAELVAVNAIRCFPA